MLSYQVRASDGDIGRVHDFLVDEDEWAVRYIVVDTAQWLFGRQVLLSPDAVGRASWADKRLDFSVTKEKIESSPDISRDMPVSRRKELEMIRHYGWTTYWMPVGALHPQPLQRATASPDEQEQEQGEGSSHLRSQREILSYSIHAKDGDIGKAVDLIVDDESWHVRYLIVDTKVWLPGRKVLISNDRIVDISWAEKELRVDLTKDEVRGSPTYDPYKPINREYETVLYDYYGCPHYWRKK